MFVCIWNCPKFKWKLIWRLSLRLFELNKSAVLKSGCVLYVCVCVCSCSKVHPPPSSSFHGYIGAKVLCLLPPLKPNLFLCPCVLFCFACLCVCESLLNTLLYSIYASLCPSVWLSPSLFILCRLNLLVTMLVESWSAPIYMETMAGIERRFLSFSSPLPSLNLLFLLFVLLSSSASLPRTTTPPTLLCFF